jgi:hypothetical protein
VDAGSELAGEIVFERPPEGWWPELLDDGDEVELAGRRLTWRWRGEPFAKGIRVLGDPGAVESVTVTVDGEAVPAARVAVGDGQPYAGGRLGEAALRAESWPPAAAAALAPAVYLWRPAAPAPLDAVEDDAAAEETARRLRALGYIQ